MKRTKFAAILASVFFFAACASSEMSNLEDAKFALDRGEYTTAIEKATNALAEDSTNIEASRILASAYLGRSGIDFIDLAEGITDLQNSTDANFIQIARVLPTSANEDDLRLAIETLRAIPGLSDAVTAGTATEDEGLADAIFDLAFMQVIESFSLGVYGSNFNTSLDVTLVTDADRNNAAEDLLGFDNFLVVAGVDEAESFIEEIRQTYWILEPITGAAGFTTGEYRALVGCQLSSSPATFNTLALTGNTVANCAALSPDSQTDAVKGTFTNDTI